MPQSGPVYPVDRMLEMFRHVEITYLEKPDGQGFFPDPRALAAWRLALERGVDVVVL